MQPLESLETDALQKVKQLEREIVETEKALAQETLDHARTKETLAYTRGLLDRADKSETAIHKFLDKQEERHTQIVAKLEEKVIDANRKIATIARELGAKEERVALLAGPGRLPGAVAEEAAKRPPARLPYDVPLIWTALGAALTFGIWAAQGWNLLQRATATSAIWCVMAWFVLKFWAEVSRVESGELSAGARRLRNFCRAAAVLGGFLAVAFLAIAWIEG